MSEIDYIVSLTTIPAKVEYIYNTLDSLLCQTMPVKAIVINIPASYSLRFDNASIDSNSIEKIKDTYKNKNIIINHIENDYGPGTKLLGLLQSYILDDYSKESFIVIVDDDLIYKQDVIETFHKRYQLDNNINFASFWGYEYNDVYIGQAADMLFIKKKHLSVFNSYFNIIKQYNRLLFHDDFYISYYFYLLNIPLIIIEQQENNIEQQENSIYDITDAINIDALNNLEGELSREELCHYAYNTLNNMLNRNMFFFADITHQNIYYKNQKIYIH